MRARKTRAISLLWWIHISVTGVYGFLIGCRLGISRLRRLITRHRRTLTVRMWLRRLIVLRIRYFRWKGQALAYAHLFLVGGRRGMLAFLLMLLLKLGVQIRVNAQWLDLLIILDLWGTLALLGVLLLSHSHECLPVIIRPAHYITSRREHTLYLPVLIIDHLVASLLRMHHRIALASKIMTSWGLLGRRLVVLAVGATAADALPPSTEEAFHAVEVANSSILLGRLLCLTLSSVNLLVRLLLVLQLATVVSKTLLRPALTVWTQWLNLAL